MSKEKKASGRWQVAKGKGQGIKRRWQETICNLQFAACLLCFLVLFVTNGWTQISTKGKPRYAPGEVIVKYKTGIPESEQQSGLQKAGLTVIKRSETLGFLRCQLTIAQQIGLQNVTPQQVNSTVQACRAASEVEYAEPNYYFYAIEAIPSTNGGFFSARQNSPVIPNDPRFGELWGLNNGNDADIDAPEAWATQTGSNDIIVGVIDTGIDYNHEDLKDNIWLNPGESGNGKENNGIDDDGNDYKDDFRGWDFVFDTNDPADDNDHGTHVAGTIGAIGNNGKGVAGVSWRVKLMALKFLGQDGSGTEVDAAEAIVYATRMGAKILSNSWGGGERSRALEDAIRFAQDHGVLFIAAAGNDGANTDNSPNYPSNYEVPNVISVASSDRNDNLSGFSNFGRRTVDLAAPGSSILSTRPLNRYQSLSGTSMATPHVSGVAALIWAQYPGLTMHQVMVRLLGAVDRKSAFVGKMTAGGRLNAANTFSTNPLIAQTTDWDNTPNTAGPYTVTTSAVDEGGIASVNLNYSINGGPTSSVVMTATGNDSYTADIPGQPLETTITYLVVAADNGGNRTSSPTFSFKITTETGDNGCCGQRAMSFDGLDEPVRWAVEIPANIAFFLIPIILLRRRKR
jgi:subtilisin family serine protease